MASRQSTPIVENGNLSREQILAAHPAVPDHVVYREFVNETVVLNLETGTYHGLNPSGGKMFEMLKTAVTVGDAVTPLSEYYGRPPLEIEQDLYEFCVSLREYGLIELT